MVIEKGAENFKEMFTKYEQAEKAKEKQFQKEQDEDCGNGKIGRIRKQLWNLTEYPETSKAALILGYLSLGLVIVSTISLCSVSSDNYSS